ncbi:coenzyme F420 hydrogenase subunit alpha [Methanosphaera sp. ISO3-F5]|uniref:coenzyme F420 hydrogenase subunit alpha n=1 Tax=Methanosphaera sp. ISO3-F5 TaxID=1452353 RepID=UPI002B262F88|nr:coenzyme F420 hydrogenase subunit alpha [Methanosphaera sp. ISO3-F5]WQH64386.1 coenzyme F420 hydrogenase subunit alpha [Methanosphaera sp. ISO3-F5]
MSKTITISPTSRQEGHATLSLEVDDQGIVTTGRYYSITPVRGIEKMVIGKRPETAPVLVQRICGVCPVTHTLASVEAIDDSLKIDVPKTGKILREICLNAHIINSHAIHHFLVAPDFVPQEDYNQIVKNVSEIRKQAQYVEDVIGGEGIHPSDIRIGGMAHNITKNTKNKIKTRISGLKGLLEKHVTQMAEYIEQKEFPENLGVHAQPVLATSNTYGSRQNINLQSIEEIMPNSWYTDKYTQQEDEEYQEETKKTAKKIGKTACSQIPLYENTPVETGPRARADKYRKFKDKGVKAQHMARAQEMLNAADCIIDLIDKVDPSAQTMAKYTLEGTNRLGVGVIEGPRGTNLHTVKISPEGYITDYNAIVPTTWNIPTMGLATEGTHYKYAPDVIRAYDPCLSCATHMIVVDDENKEVIKEDMVQL